MRLHNAIKDLNLKAASFTSRKVNFQEVAPASTLSRLNRPSVSINMGIAVVSVCALALSRPSR